jgi:hypothetical protein
MYSFVKLVVLSVIIMMAFTGCQSQQAKVDALQRKYDQLNQQFAKDCSAEYLKVPPTLSQKCTDESEKLGEAGKRVQEERAKQ